MMRKLHGTIVRWMVGVALAYVTLSYLVLPALWRSYEFAFPLMADGPRLTRTQDGRAGDPLNVSLIGSQIEIREIMRSAAWSEADPLRLSSDLAIAADTLLKRRYDQTPISNLYLFERKEDLAFELTAIDNPRHRHHVRFWKTSIASQDGRPIWVGSASFDDRVGLSHTTGEITHHIAADVDRERDFLATCLEQTGRLLRSRRLPNFHSTTEGHNGGGDPWYTDRALWVGEIGANRSSPAFLP